MEEDVAKALAYQVKRELAERYFGLRKLIEEDTAKYFKQLEEIKQKLLPRVKEAWFRLYLLLGDRTLAEELASLLGLKGPPFYEDYLRKGEDPGLLVSLPLRGFTNKGRFKNLVLAAYERLTQAYEDYAEAFREARVEAEVINHEIELFKEKYDLSEIMQFLKSLEAPSAMADLGHTSLEESVTTLEKSLALEKIPAPESFIPAPVSLPEPKDIKKELERLAKKAYQLDPQRAKRLIAYVKAHQQG